MKTAKTLLTVMLALGMVFSLCACSFELGGEETWEYGSDDKEGCSQLFNDFFEETFKNTNQTITVKSGSDTVFVETIDGTSDYISYSTTSTDTCSFIKDGEYIYALTGEDAQYYMVGEEYYGYGYFVYKNSIDIFEMLPEEGVTFSAEVKGGKIDGESTTTMTLEIKNGDEGSVTINASAKNDLVESITVSRSEEGTTVTSTMTIVYGSASVTVPDISEWSKEEF